MSVRRQYFPGNLSPRVIFHRISQSKSRKTKYMDSWSPRIMNGVM